MEWIKEGEVAKYKSADRAGHKLHFIRANLLEELFRKDFNILSISEGTEPERIGRDVNANLIFMLRRRKNNASGEYARRQRGAVFACTSTAAALHPRLND